MTSEIVFAMYRPHEGKDAELRELIGQHIPTLVRLELVTDRAPILCRGEDGTYIEIFEWATSAAAARAHEHPEVAKVWEAMGQVADFPPLSSLAEAGKRFPHFEPIEL